jgi:sulfate adenylyltransferase large subunit
METMQRESVNGGPSELLRFTTAGSVDDGKSTLIGRLLYDSQAVYEDQLAAARRATRAGVAGPLDLSLLTDGLRAEREQGITIDVAYRYFATPRRKFIIADAPGHEQYTRNMATAASTADLAVILIDARRGVLPQSRRHAYIAALLGIPRMIVAVNKMDQMDFREEVFREIREEFTEYAERIGSREGVEFIPLSALDGDNVVTRSARMPWYQGPSLLERLETIPIASAAEGHGLRFPVQYVIRAGDFRGFAGRIEAGVARKGERVVALPSGRSSRVRSIVTWDGELEQAGAPLSVTLCLEDEIDISRGDMLVSTAHAPQTSGAFEATLVWMTERHLHAGRMYLLKHAAQTVRARVDAAMERVDIKTLEPSPATSLALNEIGRVTVLTERPLSFDAYSDNRSTGSFILIDPITNETAGAGMITKAAAARTAMARVSAGEREARNGHRPAIVLAGNDEMAARLERRLFDAGVQAVWWQGAPEAAAQLCGLGAVVIIVEVAGAKVAGVETIDISGDDEGDFEALTGRVLRGIAAG